jgi:pimeloyl-ACP methyl ester carboxylesterase
MSRFDCSSRDGVSIAVWVQGEGPAIVLVHGSVSDHTTLTPFIDELAKSMSTFSMDRRGFGASSDTSGYCLEKEFEDVATVVDAVAARTGGPVTLFGHSYGANCAMGAATMTKNIHHVVLYEPSLGLTYKPGSIEAVERNIAAGNLDAAVVAVFVDILEMTEAEIDAIRRSATPSWETRIASAATLPRECRVEESWVYKPGQFSAVSAPTLLLAGSKTPVDLSNATLAAAAALPNAQIKVLEGHAHAAHKTDPALVAGLIREFIASG